MKSLLKETLVIVGVLSALQLGENTALAQTKSMSAKQALVVLNGEKGAEAMKSIVAMRAWDGVHQPANWEIMLRSNNGVLRYLIGDEQILTSDSQAGANLGGAMDVRKLKLDSTQAFSVADRAARAVQLGFDAVDYEMRAMPNSSVPMWRLTLKDALGQKLGRVDVNGQTGVTLSNSLNKNIYDGVPGERGGDYGEYGDYSGGADDYGSYDGGASDAGGAYDAGSYVDGRDDSYRNAAENDPRHPRIDYSKYEDVSFKDPYRAEKQQRALENLRERVTYYPEETKEKAKNGFVDIGDAFRDVAKFRAEYRATGKPRVRASRVTKARRR
jgi:hypothetical protein